jgi:hypothetical protein
MRLSLVAKWFAIGLAVRLGLGIVVFLMIAFVNWESAMLYLLDVPTLFIASLLDHLFPATIAIGSGDPFYVPMNLFGGIVWGALFALAALLFSAVIPARRARVSRSQHLSRQ